MMITNADDTCTITITPEGRSLTPDTIARTIADHALNEHFGRIDAERCIEQFATHVSNVYYVDFDELLDEALDHFDSKF